MARKQIYGGKPRLTPAEQAAYDNARSTPGILIDPDGNVVFDGEADALGVPPFKTKAEIEASAARVQELLTARRKEREAEAKVAEDGSPVPRSPPPRKARRLRRG